MQNTLSLDFNKLPTNEQVNLLKQAHEEKIKGLDELSAKISEPTTTIIEPKTASETLYDGKLDMFAPITSTDADQSNNLTNDTPSNVKEAYNENTPEISGEMNKSDVKVIKM